MCAGGTGATLATGLIAHYTFDCENAETCEHPRARALSFVAACERSDPLTRAVPAICAPKCALQMATVMHCAWCPLTDPSIPPDSHTTLPRSARRQRQRARWAGAWGRQLRRRYSSSGAHFLAAERSAESIVFALQAAGMIGRRALATSERRPHSTGRALSWSTASRTVPPSPPAECPAAFSACSCPGWCLQMTGAAHSRYRSGSPAGVWIRAAPAPAAGMTCLAALRSATTTTAASFPMAVSIAVSLEALLSISQSCVCRCRLRSGEL